MRRERRESECEGNPVTCSSPRSFPCLLQSLIPFPIRLILLMITRGTLVLLVSLSLSPLSSCRRINTSLAVTVSLLLSSCLKMRVWEWGQEGGEGSRDQKAGRKRVRGETVDNGWSLNIVHANDCPVLLPLRHPFSLPHTPATLLFSLHRSLAMRGRE